MSQENFSQKQQETPTKTQTMDDIVKEVQSATDIISKLNNNPSVPLALKNKMIQDNERIIAELQSRKMDMLNAENKRKEEVAGFSTRFDIKSPTKPTTINDQWTDAAGFDRDLRHGR
jgi:hypothetical protein